jgi:hypothetical protein
MMRCSPHALPAVAVSVFLLFTGCGDSSSPNFEVPAATTSAEVEMEGNVVPDDIPADAVILAYAFADLPSGGDLSQQAPVSLDIVRQNGSFVLSVPPGGTITVIFLADNERDGVIDPRDTTAVLSDPGQQLRDLQEGDRVELVDVDLDFPHRQAAGTINVTRTDRPTATPTSSPAADTPAA